MGGVMVFILVRPFIRKQKSTCRGGLWPKMFLEGEGARTIGGTIFKNLKQNKLKNFTKIFKNF